MVEGIRQAERQEMYDSVGQVFLVRKNGDGDSKVKERENKTNRGNDRGASLCKEWIVKHAQGHWFYVARQCSSEEKTRNLPFPMAIASAP